jgi:hypothetical protein
MRIGQRAMAVVVVAVMLGTVGIASLAGWWQTTNQKKPGTVSDSTGTSRTDPADIKGSFTFGEISSLYKVPLEDLGTAFRIPEDTSVSAFQCKSLESLGLSGDSPWEIGVPSVRWFVALYTGVAHTPGDSTGLTAEAVAVLLEKVDLDEATKRLIAERTVAD